MKFRGLALAWFRKEDWPRWCAMDSQFQPSYTHWRGRMDAAFATYQAAGVPVLKVVIEPDEFLAWSKANGKGVGTNERAEFAVWKMMQNESRGERA